MSDARWIALIDELRVQPNEADWFEFKTNNAEPHMIGKRISAIANAARLADKHYGYVVWGIADGSHDVVGTTFSHSKKKGNEPLEMWLAKMLSPSPLFRFVEVPHPNGRLVLLEIPAATHAPVKFDHVAYIRIGSATPRLVDFPDREAKLWNKLHPYAWETALAAQFVTSDYVLQHLDYAAYFELTGRPLPDNRKGVLDSLANDRLIEADVGGNWNITNLGAILFAKNLDEFKGLKRKAVRLVQYSGKDQSKILRRRDGQKGYAAGFSGLVGFINGVTQGAEPIGQALRKRGTVYPQIAIRELVANALIHQDMTIPGTGPLIEIFSDRIEIMNPGAPLIEPNRMIDMPPLSRNQDLASLMRRMGICEEQGSGLNKVVSAVEQSKLPPADWRSVGNNFKAYLYAARSIKPRERVLAAYQHAVLRWLAGERLTNGSLGERLGIDKKNASMISRVIRDTQKAGLIKPADPNSPRAGYVPSWV